MPEIWFSFLYQPLLNVLVWIYNNMSGQSMGWAVIFLTIGLRFALLPLSIISQRDVLRQRAIEEEARKEVQSFKKDPIAQKEEYRRIMRANRISPWAKVIVLGIQFLVLVLLYQVFISGIFGEKLVRVLYPSISFPGAINNDFFGHDIGLRHDIFWAGIVAVYLFVYNLIQKYADKTWNKSEFIFLFVFPLFTFVVLWFLPMAKSLFILTSMIFSDILTFIRVALFSSPETAEESEK